MIPFRCFPASTTFLSPLKRGGVFETCSGLLAWHLLLLCGLSAVGRIKEKDSQGSWDGFDSWTIPPAAPSGFLSPPPEASMTVSVPLIRAKLNSVSIYCTLSPAF